MSEPQEMSKLHVLAEGYLEGDAETQKQLLQAVQPLVLNYVRSSMGGKLRSLEESVDISQSLLLGLHLRLTSGEVRFDHDSALKGYLRQMVRNKLAKRASAAGAAKRGGGTTPQSLDDDVSLPPPADDLTASMVLRVKETKDRIESQIGDEERIILEGRLLGRTMREIAVELGKSPDAVHMIWARSRRKLIQKGVLRTPGTE